MELVRVFAVSCSAAEDEGEARKLHVTEASVSSAGIGWRPGAGARISPAFVVVGIPNSTSICIDYML